MRLEAKKYLFDMRQAAALLSEFTAGKTFAFRGVPCEVGDSHREIGSWLGSADAGRKVALVREIPSERELTTALDAFAIDKLARIMATGFPAK